MGGQLRNSIITNWKNIKKDKEERKGERKKGERITCKHTSFTLCVCASNENAGIFAWGLVQIMKKMITGNRSGRAKPSQEAVLIAAITASILISGCGGSSQMYETTATVCTTGMAVTAAAAGEENDAGGYDSLAGNERWNGSSMDPGSDLERKASLAARYQDAYQQEDWNTEEYGYIEENGYQTVAAAPLSTFSVDVDTASYGNIRRMIRSGANIPEDAVRIEEMINYFDYDYPEPDGEEPFLVTTEYSSCPWNEDSRLLLIGLQAKEIDFTNRPATNLVFLLDVSGSMYSDDKLPLVQKAFTMLTENLDERDKISIVTYAGYESVILDGVSGTEKGKIAAALEDLEAGGSTAGSAGIEKAYELAQKHFIPGGNNRVLLATDGDLNVGVSSEGGLIRMIQEKKKSGVHLSVLGVGTGNIKDNKMEALADNGDGNYNYLDSIYEAKKVLVDEMGGTLITVAKDVKIQVEFNPEQVAGYRLIGYENRMLNQEDFHDDKADAGEIGSGHSVTALYEIIPATEAGTEAGLKYQTTGTTTGSSELLTVSVRYKAPNGDTSRLLEYPVESGSYQEEGSENLTFAAAVAEFGMVLRNSEHKGTANFDSIMALAESCISRDFDDYRKEFLDLVQTAAETR